MASNGMEEAVEFDLVDPPWEQPIPRITLDICFWFGVEKVNDSPSDTNSGSNSGSQTWSDLIQELESTIYIYTELNAESAKRKLVIERFQKASSSIKSVDQRTIAHGQRAEWIKRELKGLQGGVEELRRIISTGEPVIQDGCIESTKSNENTSEDLKLRSERLITEKVKLQNDISKLKKKVATKDVEITELSETVYRLQCENDMLKGESTSDDDREARDNIFQEASHEIVKKERPQKNHKSRDKKNQKVSISLGMEQDNTEIKAPLYPRLAAPSPYAPQKLKLNFATMETSSSKQDRSKTKILSIAEGHRGPQPTRFSNDVFPPEPPKPAKPTSWADLLSPRAMPPTSSNSPGATQPVAPRDNGLSRQYLNGPVYETRRYDEREPAKPTSWADLLSPRAMPPTTPALVAPRKDGWKEPSKRDKRFERFREA